MKNLICIGIILTLFFHFTGCKHEKPADKMDWWKEAKFGMFIHWGLYSVPAGEFKGQEIGGIGEWIMNNGKIPVDEYAQYATHFNPTNFNADEWVKMAKDAGMKYIVITSKHHDGFAMFDSKVSNYDIMDATPFKRDIIKEMADACKKQGMAFGLYYSQAQDWHVPGGAAIGGHWDPAQNGDMDKYLDEVAVQQVTEILNNYGDIKVLWWDTPQDMTPERAAKFMPELAKHPNLIYNNRLGGGIDGDLETPEQFIPATGIPGKNWESCMTMNDTWGFKKNDQNWKSAEILIRNLVEIASKGGNYLLNVGPTPDGLIPQPSIDRLKEIGTWLKTNSEAIYGTTASPFKKLDWGRCTIKKQGSKNKLYLHIFDYPTDEILIVPGFASKINKAYPLNNRKKNLQFESIDNNLRIDISGIEKDRFATVIVLETSDNIIVYNGPEIIAGFTTFIDKAEFGVSTDIPNSIVRYTIDGTEPTSQSTEVKEFNEISSASSFVVKAKCFLDGKPISGVVEKEFVREEPAHSIALKKFSSGLKYSYYEGNWLLLPDFAALKPVMKGITEKIDLSIKKRDSEYGIVYNGFLQVPETGIYKFILSSDDGSKLTIAGKVLSNDGRHAVESKTLNIALEKGFHPLELQFFQASGGNNLKLEWEPKGKERAEIDRSLFSN